MTKETKGSTPVPNRPDPAEAAMKASGRRPDPTTQKPDGEGYDVIDDHMTLQNQSSVRASQYPKKDRDAQSLVTPKK